MRWSLGMACVAGVVTAVLTGASVGGAGDDLVVHKFERQKLTDVYFSEGANAGDLNRDGNVGRGLRSVLVRGARLQDEARDLSAQAAEPRGLRRQLLQLGLRLQRRRLERRVRRRFSRQARLRLREPQGRLRQATGRSTRSSTRSATSRRTSSTSSATSGPNSSARSTARSASPRSTGRTRSRSGPSTPSRSGPRRSRSATASASATSTATAATTSSSPTAGSSSPRRSRTTHAGRFTRRSSPTPTAAPRCTPTTWTATAHNDVITSLAAHDFGLAWYEQDRSGPVTVFREHLIMGKNRQAEPLRHRSSASRTPSPWWTWTATG